MRNGLDSPLRGKPKEKPMPLRGRLLRLAAARGSIRISEAASALPAHMVRAAEALHELAASGLLVRAVADARSPYVHSRYYPTLKGYAWLAQRKSREASNEEKDQCRANR